MSEPTVSVVMPVWNACTRGREDYFRAAIESILEQVYEDWELIAVIDPSTDDSEAILQAYAEEEPRIQVLVGPERLGLASALNRGIEASRGSYVARMDADDMSTVTRLQVQVDFMDSRPETVLCGSGMYLIDEEGKLKGEHRHPTDHSALRSALRTGCRFVHGSVMFRRAPVVAVGGYSTEPAFLHAEDYELWVRLAAEHVVENIPGRSLYFHRDHGAKVSFAYRRQQEEATRRVMQKAATLLA